MKNIKKKNKKRLEDEDFDRKYTFKFFKELPKLFKNIIAVGIIDKNKKGLISYPRYSLKVLVDKNLSTEKFDELYETLEQLVCEKNYNEEKNI